MSNFHLSASALMHNSKIITYPCGVVDILCSSSPDFHEPGWEEQGRRGTAAPAGAQRRAGDEAKAEDEARSMRRARAKVRRIALANDFRWFVTLTLDQQRVDRYDPAAVIRKLNQWCSNQVKRRGLRYILVPERHKDGALHFHGFFSDSLEAVASGHTDKAGHMIYNFPGWTLGFTAGIEVYGDYPAAVAYCCKYIGKQGDKPAGRWYYSGGQLAEPKCQYADLEMSTLKEEFANKCYALSVPGRQLLIINGIRGEVDDLAEEDAGDALCWMGAEPGCE